MADSIWPVHACLVLCSAQDVVKMADSSATLQHVSINGGESHASLRVGGGWVGG